MFSSFRQAIEWFIGGLVEAAGMLEDHFTRGGRIRVIRVGLDYAIEQADGKRETTQLRLENEGKAARFSPAETAAALKDKDVDLVFPADELLVRTLDPLPAESKPYLDGIVRHQLERVAPWRSSDVLYSYHVTAAGPNDNRLLVTIAATARSLHERVLSALAASGPRELRLLYRDVPQTNADVAIPVNLNGASSGRAERLRKNVTWGLVGLATVILLCVLGAVAALQQSSDSVDQADRAVRDLRQKLVAAGGRGVVGDRDFDSILGRRRSSPYAVLAIDALAAALPDDTSLTELRIGEGRLRISGVSRNVAGLVPLIEGSPAFSEATFFAPTTRLPNGQGDRFHLEARLMPAANTKKQ